VAVIAGILTARMMSAILTDMRTVKTREIQRDTRAIRGRLLAGESLQWVMGEHVIGYLTPASSGTVPKPWPNLAKRLQAICGPDTLSTQPATQTIYDDRD